MAWIDDLPTVSADSLAYLQAGFDAAKAKVIAPVTTDDGWAINKLLGDSVLQAILDELDTRGVIPGSGVVTSVGLALPAQFTVTNSPVTGSGTLTGAWVNQAAAKVFAGPATGADAAPTFRVLAATDIPALAYAATGHNHNTAYPALVGTSVVGNFVSFSGITGAQADSGVSAASFATAAHLHTGVYAPAFTSGTANYVWATPNGSAGTPSLRALVAADIPALSYAPAWSGMTTGDLLYASAATTVGRITAVPAGRFLVSAGTGTVPAYAVSNDIKWDATNKRLGIGMGAGTSAALLSVGYPGTYLDRRFIWLDGAAVSLPTRIAGFGLRATGCIEYWPSANSRVWGAMSITDGTTLNEQMTMNTYGNLIVGGETAPSSTWRLLVKGNTTQGDGVGVTCQNTNTTDLSTAMFNMLAGTDGAGGQFFGTRSTAYATYGVCNGVTFGPNSNTQDLAMRAGADRSGTREGGGFCFLLDATNRHVSIGHASSGPSKLSVRKDDATTNAVTDVLTLDKTTSGTAAVGMGVGIAMRLENAAGTTKEAASIDTVWVDATNASEDAKVVTRIQIAGTVTDATTVTEDAFDFRSKAGFTKDGGHYVVLTNKTGANSVKGMIVCASTVTDNAFMVAPTQSAMNIGVVYDSGIADGQECRVVFGGRAQVMLVDGTSSPGDWVYLADDAAGKAYTRATPYGWDDHGWQVGQCLEGVAGDPDTLAWVMISQN